MTYVKLPTPGKGKIKYPHPGASPDSQKPLPRAWMPYQNPHPPPPPPGITLIGALFGYIHYCTEISEININLLPNTCSFHCKFRRYISLRMRKMCTLEKLNFKISRGSMPPDPPSIPAPSALDIIFARLTLNCFRRACYFQSAILSIILCILRTQKDISSLSRKGLLTWGPLKLKVPPLPPPPPPKKLRTRLSCNKFKRSGNLPEKSEN